MTAQYLQRYGIIKVYLGLCILLKTILPTSMWHSVSMDYSGDMSEFPARTISRRVCRRLTRTVSRTSPHTCDVSERLQLQTRDQSKILGVSEFGRLACGLWPLQRYDEKSPSKHCLITVVVWLLSRQPGSLAPDVKRGIVSWNTASSPILHRKA